MTEQKCPFVEFMQEQQYCGKHQFLHGGEANHLRQELEKLVEELDGQEADPLLCACGKAAVEEAMGEVYSRLRRILEIDARDSLACLEQAKLEESGG